MTLEINAGTCRLKVIASLCGLRMKVVILTSAKVTVRNVNIATPLNACSRIRPALTQSSKRLHPAGKGKHGEINDLFHASRKIEQNKQLIRLVATRDDASRRNKNPSISWHEVLMTIRSVWRI